MAMGGPRRRGKAMPMAEINVTPMVDVMLVLLIIFMVTAPLLVAGVPVDLPNSKASALKTDDVPIQISMDKAGRIYIDKQEVAPAALDAKLAAIRGARQDDARVYVRADRSLDYGRVMEVVGEISAAGFKKVALVSEAKREGGDPRPVERGLGRLRPPQGRQGRRRGWCRERGCGDGRDRRAVRACGYRGGVSMGRDRVRYREGCGKRASARFTARSG